MSRYLDLLERTVWTFVQAGLAVWIATGVDLFSLDALKVAAVAGVIAAAKCLLAFQVGSPNTAAALPAGPVLTTADVTASAGGTFTLNTDSDGADL